MSNPTSDQSNLWDLIKGIRFGMLTHHTRQGLLRSLPLTTQNKSLDEGSVLCFFISANSDLAADLAQNALVNAAYADPDTDSYVSISGRARTSKNPARVEQLWSAPAKAWFPKGPADPDLLLLEVDITQAEYWDVKEAKITQLVKMATAAVTGNPPQMGEHKKVHVT
jgi:general stress protein 26